MQTIQVNDTRRIEAGQLWKMELGYVYIVESGKRLIKYKMLRSPDQKAALTRLISIEAMHRYLGQSEAELMSSPVPVTTSIVTSEPSSQINPLLLPMFA